VEKYGQALQAHSAKDRKDSGLCVIRIKGQIYHATTDFQNLSGFLLQQEGTQTQMTDRIGEEIRWFRLYCIHNPVLIVPCHSDDPIQKRLDPEVRNELPRKKRGKRKTHQIRTRRATRRRVGISRGYISATISNISRSSSSGKTSLESASSSVMVVKSKVA
jgi:hypothetical protein